MFLRYQCFLRITLMGINQLDKYANIQIKLRKVDPKTMIKYTEQMEQYLKERRELTKAYQALLRK